MIPLADINRQDKGIKNEIENEIKKVLERGWFILGKELEEFEKEFAEYCGKKFGIGVGNGTDAIFLTLKAFEIGNSDEIITVANTAIPTVSAIVATGAKPILVDCGEDYLIDVSKIEEKINSKTKAIVPVHLYGQVCDMEKILEIAEKYNLKVVEDCAQAHGAELNNKKVPIGKIGCFSFYPSKNLGAYGDGGMIITDDEKLNEKLKLLRNYGQTGIYSSIISGYNSRLDEIQSAILRVKLKHLDKWNKQRIEIAEEYNKKLNCEKQKINQDKKHIFHLYIIRHKKRDELIEHLKSKEITTKIHYPIPIHLQKGFEFLGYGVGDFPMSEKFSKEILSLPIFPGLTKEEIEKICDEVNRFHSI